MLRNHDKTVIYKIQNRATIGIYGLARIFIFINFQKSIDKICDGAILKSGGLGYGEQ